MHLDSLRAALIPALFLIAACQSEVVSPHPHANIPRELRRLDGRRSATLDERFVAITSELPEFGGVFVDENGDLVAQLTSLTAIGRATPILMAAFGHRVAPGRHLLFRTAKYNAAALASWHTQMDTSLDWTGVVFTDFDEVQNRVTVGVLSADKSPSVLATASRLGIPADAIAVIVSPPARPTTAFFDRIRPVIGGIQMVTAYGGTSLHTCTIGFNTYYSGVAAFVSASHCTKRYGLLDTSTVYQASYVDRADSIGYEVADPAFTDSPTGCTPHHLCRYSDAAVFAYFDSTQMSFGKLAHGLDSTGTTFNLSSTPFSLDGGVADADLLIGTTVEKDGTTTGWTSGSIYGTCETVQPSDQPGHYLVCSYYAWLGTSFGDSGGPVFVRSGANTALLAGIVWGSNLFSSYDGLQADLGSLWAY